MPVWLEELLPIVILLAAVTAVIARLPKVEGLDYTKAFRKRRVMNWVPLGLTYAFLYMGRYNLKVSQKAFEKLTAGVGDALAGGVAGGANEPIMSSAEFATIFGVGTVVYGFAFLINGPLTDRYGGRKAILVGAGGAALMNVLMGLCTLSLTTGGMGSAFVAQNFVLLFSVLYAANMYFQSFGAVAIVKVNAPWFHVRERGVIGAVFGILISLGVYFAFDWSGKILNIFVFEEIAPSLKFFVFDEGKNILNLLVLDEGGKILGNPASTCLLFFAPAVLLAVFWTIDLFVVRNTPGEAGHEDFELGDATSGDTGPRLRAVKVFKMMLRNPIIMTIACIEFCSGFLRQSIMQWYQTFADHTDKTLHLGEGFVNKNWGMLLCAAGILGGVVAGVIPDRVFQSRRGPVAAILYGVMLVSSLLLTFLYQSPIVGYMVVFMSLAVIGVHGMLSGTASMDFGGSKNAGIAVGIIDGFVYLGTAAMSLTYGLALPVVEKDAAGHVVGPTTDPANWQVWPVAMIPLAVIGFVLALRVWNAKPKPKSAPAH